MASSSWLHIMYTYKFQDKKLLGSQHLYCQSMLDGDKEAVFLKGGACEMLSLPMCFKSHQPFVRKKCCIALNWCIWFKAMVKLTPN